MLQTAMTKDADGKRYVEFASLDGNAVTRTQIEYRDGRVYMRAKRRTYCFT